MTTLTLDQAATIVDKALERGREFGVRDDADADQHEVGLEPLAAGQFDMIDPPPA